MMDHQDLAGLQEQVAEYTELVQTIIPTLQRVAHAQAADRAAIAALLLVLAETAPDRLAVAERHIKDMVDSLRPASPEVAASLEKLLESFQQPEEGRLADVARRRARTP